jgi:putative membrane protein
MIRIFAYAIAAIVATLTLGTISQRLIEFSSPAAVILFGLVIGVINAFLKPVVQTISLPLTCLTFGLFALVVNAGLFKLGAAIVPDVQVSWWGAFIGAILTSLASGIIFSVIDE